MSTCNVKGCKIPSHNHEISKEPRTMSTTTTKAEPVIMNVDVSKGEPVTVQIKAETVLICKGNKVAEKRHVLRPGTYVVNEVLKTLFITNGRGGYQKHDKVHMILAERTA